MQKKNRKEIMESLLKEKASESEREFLSELGFSVKNPTKHPVIMAALYKKAVGGDLSAIKEVRSILGDATADGTTDLRVVRIVDDIGN